MTKRLPQLPAKLRLAVLLLVVVLGLAGVAVLRHDTRQPAPPANSKTLTNTTDTPAETTVSAGYSVAADQPLSIEIAGRGIEGFIQKVGIDQNKAVTAPNNVHLAGWFADSVLPGEKGLSVIDGHVNGVSQPGIFGNLAKVTTGDKVVITYGDKSTRSFTVFGSKSVKTEDADQYLFSQDPAVTSQLNLITCTGKYTSAQQAYDQRLIVFTKLGN